MSKRTKKYTGAAQAAEETLAKVVAGTADLQDEEQVFASCRRAAERGSVQAQNALGWCYETALGTKQDYGQALNWYEKAAGGGLPEAALNLQSLRTRLKNQGTKLKNQEASLASVPGTAGQVPASEAGADTLPLVLVAVLAIVIFALMYFLVDKFFPIILYLFFVYYLFKLFIKVVGGIFY